MVQLHGRNIFYVPWTGAMLDYETVHRITSELIYNDGRLDAPNHSLWYQDNSEYVHNETGALLDLLTIHAIFRSLIWDADPTDGKEIWLDEFDEDGRDDFDYWTWQTVDYDIPELPVVEAYPEVANFELEGEEEEEDD